MKTKLPRIALLFVLTFGSVASSPAQNAPGTPAQGNVILSTRSYRVSPDFLLWGKTPANPAARVDPFAAAAPPVAGTARTVLETFGISFTTAGSSADFDKNSSRLIVKNTAEQLDMVEAIVAQVSTQVLEGLVHLEAFSLPPLAARKALIAHPKESALYAWLDAEMTKPASGVRLERHSLTRVRGGQRSKTEANDEHPYPTEFDPPEIPQTISLPVAAAAHAVPGGEKVFAPWPLTFTVGRAFATRNVGWTAEIELTISKDGKTADVNLAPENSRLVATMKYGLTGEIQQPVFETQKCNAPVTTLLGQPALVSTFSPPLTTGAPGGNTDDRVWLLFVTVNVPR